MARPGTFKPGQSGNPAGRPPLGDSLAEQIRQVGTPQRRARLLESMWGIAEGEKDLRVRIQAAEWLAKHGWPEEGRGVTTVKTDSAGNVSVIHEHLPSKQ